MTFREYKNKLRQIRKHADWHQCPDCGMPVQEWAMNCPYCGSQDVLGRQWPMVDHPTEPPMQTPPVPDTIPQDFERPSLYGPMPELPSNPDESSSGLTVPEHFQHGDMVSPQQFEEFMGAYFEAALWSSSIEEDFARHWAEQTGEEEPASDTSLESFGFTPEDIDESSKFEATQDCRNFCNDNAADLNEYAGQLGWGQAGHDFWLTRNGHGAGFWDRGLGELGDRLTKAAKVYGESSMYPGADGKVYIT